MKPLLFLLFTTATLLGQGGSYCSYMTGDPRLYANKFGLVAYYGLFDTNSITLNGAGASKVLDKTGNTNDLLQGTAANQPLVSRNDNKGNLVVQSSQFSTTWSRSKINAFGATDTGAAGAGSFANTARTTDPLGGNTADFIQEDATAGSNHAMSQSSVTSGGSHTFAIYAKAAGRTWLALQITGYAYFDLSGAGAVGATGGGLTSATIQSLPDGWYLCKVISSLAAGSVACNVFMASADNTSSYNGDNTSGLYIWGASLRQSTWDSDYIATTSTIAVPGLNGKTTAYFDGANHYLKTAAFTLNQPTTVVWVGKQVAWLDSHNLFDGNANGSAQLFQYTVSPRVALYAGSTGPTNNNVTLGSYKIVSTCINGASSTITVNNGTTVTGNPGSANMGGFTLGAGGNGTALGNEQVSQVLLFNRALLTNEVTAIQRWAQGIGGTALAF